MPIAAATSLAPQARVRAAIAQAASSTGVDFQYLYDQAKVESGLNPQAKATTSSAAGLYQFTDQTWLRLLKTHGADHGAGWAASLIERAGGRLTVADPTQRAAIDKLKLEPEMSSIMAAEFAQDNKGQLEDGLGRGVEPTELYLAHFLGSAGAVKFLTAYDADPSAAAAPLFPAAAAANRSVFYGPGGVMRSLSEIRTGFASRLNADSEQTPPTRSVSVLAPTQQWVENHHSAVSAPASSALEMATIEPLPPHLSLDYAARAYQRLAGMGI